MAGSTLTTGQSISGARYDDKFDYGLVSVGSAPPGHTLGISYCRPSVDDWSPPERVDSTFILGTVSPTTMTCTMTMQPDGNLVLRGDNRVIWGSRTSGLGVRNQVVMQTDGNAVMRSATGAVVWSSDSGVVVPIGLVSGHGLLPGQYVANGNTHFGLSSAGDVYVSRNGSIVRSACQAGRGGAKLIMQTDGDLVLYRKDGHALWDTHTGTRGSHIAVLASGDVAVTAPNGKAVWHTNTVMP